MNTRNDADEDRRALSESNDSAALTSGTPPSLVTHFILEHGRLLFSRETFAELETRLWRPKFDRYLTLEQRQALLHDFSAATDWVELDQHDHDRMRFSRDPDDDKFVWTALVGDADWLVSGDADLLDLATAQEKVRILSPARAPALIREAD
ncbi:putative toxin-antitoxin system toxin component, PIN family [Thiocapsa sp.]|uniref:putative toxin-antitoxin system toxin component, PIN family n=1 Tax=Thiocapsa sp. TaxID=2024551 RepID=UPI0025DFDDE2|nr:putative toxin-antitoxin system toxin component, PIN family [Thiocapsa sp.]